MSLPPEIIQLAGEGRRIFPVKTRAKTPLIRDWPTQATSDTARIEEWSATYPGANWGMLTGPAGGVLGLDIDRKNPEADGLLWLESMTALHTDDFLKTRTVITPSQGKHLHYCFPNGTEIHNSASALALGVDVRALNGFLLVPPSSLPTGSYSFWTTATYPLIELPPWLLELLQAASRGKAQPELTTDEAGGIPKGARNASLASLAGVMRRCAMDADSIAAALLIENTRKRDPPLPTVEVQTIATSIGRYPPASDPFFAGALTQDCIASSFVERETDIRYCERLGRWYVFDGTRWREDDRLIVANAVREFIGSLAGQFPEGRKARESFATITAVTNLLKMHPRYAIEVGELDAYPLLLNTPNGTLDLLTGEMREARPADYLTKSTSVSPSGECPLWLRFLQTVTAGNEELIAYLQRVAYYACRGDASQDCLFFLYGSGANGKSTFIVNLSRALGDYAVVSSNEIFMQTRNESHPTGLARLRGARLVTTSEIKDGRWNEEFLKNVSGGGKLTARFMRQDFFEFDCNFKLLISGNCKPRLSTVDRAMRRRFNLVPFEVQIPDSEVDRDLRDVKLPRELPGILQWMLDGRKGFLEQGLNPPTVVREGTAEYLAEEDQVGRWLADCCSPNAKRRMTAQALYDSFKRWALAEGESFIRPQKWLGQELKKRGYLPSKSGSTRYWTGLELLAEPESY